MCQSLIVNSIYIYTSLNFSWCIFIVYTSYVLIAVDKSDNFCWDHIRHLKLEILISRYMALPFNCPWMQQSWNLVSYTTLHVKAFEPINTNIFCFVIGPRVKPTPSWRCGKKNIWEDPIIKQLIFSSWDDSMLIKDKTPSYDALRLVYGQAWMFKC